VQDLGFVNIDAVHGYTPVLTCFRALRTFNSNLLPNQLSARYVWFEPVGSAVDSDFYLTWQTI